MSASEPIRLESGDVFSQGVFNQDYLEEAEQEPFDDNPMVPMMRAAAVEYVKAIRAQPVTLAELPKTEHKVRIFRFAALAKSKEIAAIESAIESYLNDGYCCHMPTVVGDYVIMDFSRRKESEEE